MPSVPCETVLFRFSRHYRLCKFSLASFSSDVCDRNVSILQSTYSWRNTRATWSREQKLSSFYPFPFYVGSMFLMRRFHLIRQCCSSPDSSLSDKSFLMLSNHLYFGLPLLLFHGTSITITLLPTHYSSLLNTCSYHFKLFSCTFLDIFPTFSIPLILSFPILFSLVTPLIHLDHLISATYCDLFTDHVHWILHRFSPLFVLYLIVLGEINDIRYQRYLSFTLRCFQLLVQLIHCPRLGCATALFAALFACL